MARFKTVKRNFTSLPNEVIQGFYLSANALAVLVTCLSYPDDWQYRPISIWKSLKIGRNKTYEAFQELVEHGHCLRIRSLKGNLKAEVDYVFFDEVSSCEKFIQDNAAELNNPEIQVEHKWNFKKVFRRSDIRDTEGREPEGREVLKKIAMKKDLDEKRSSYCETSAETKPSSDTVPAGGNKNVSFSSSEKEKGLEPSLPTQESKKTTTPELYKCLDQCIDLSDRQKSRFLAFPEPLVESIVRYCYHHSTQIKGGPIGRLKLMQHMASNFEDYAESVDALDKPKEATTPEPKTSKREQLLSAFKHGEVYNGYEFFRDSIGAGFIHPTMTMSESCSAKWTDPKFNEKFKKILEKLKINI